MTSQRAKKYETKLLLPLDGMGLEIWQAHIDKIKEQDVNPRVQSPDMFEQLIANIKKNKRLESLPLCAKRENDKGIWFELISGHHRVRAAKSAGLQTIIILVDITNLDRDGVISKQLAHNNIDGITDVQLANRLYNEIQSIDFKIEAFMDAVSNSKTFSVTMQAVNARIDWHNVTFLFLPKSISNLDILVEYLDGVNYVYCSSIEGYDKFIEAVRKIKSVKDIKNTGAAIDFMIECALEKIFREPGNEPGFPD